MNAAHTPTPMDMDMQRQNMFEVALDDTKQETYTNESGGKQSRIGVDMTLLPLDGLLRAAAIMTSNNVSHGGKYERNNWRNIGLRDHIAHAYLHIAKAGAMLDKAEMLEAKAVAAVTDEMVDDYTQLAAEYEELARQEMAHAACRTLFATSELNV